MKPLLTQHRRHGLTRTELIVSVIVLGVVGFLAFPMFLCGCGGDAGSARLALTSTVIRAAVIATENYAQDYKSFPAVASPRSPNESFILVGSPSAGASQSNAALFDVLRAISRGPNAGHKLNHRQQKYFEERKAIDPKTPREGFADGKDFPDAIQGQLLDPWGQQYCVVLETGNNGSLDLSSIYSDLTGPENIVKKGVGVFSLGKDGELGGKQNRGKLKTSDGVPSDIVSWQLPD